jgi:anti-sigma B factor antagonist
MAMNVTSAQKAQGIFIVTVAGSLDSNTYKQFEQKLEALLSAGTELIVFDLESLTYLSSAGVRVFLKVRKVLKNRGGQVKFLNLQPQIKRVFEIINAIPSMQIFQNSDELDRYLDAQIKKVVAGED